MQAINETDFVAENFVNVNRDGGEQLVMVAKATFALPDSSSDNLVRLDHQRPIEYTDICEGEAGASSVRYEADFGMVKLGTDIALVGHAIPQRANQGVVDVTLRADQLNKVVRVFGDRVWRSSVGSTSISRPRAIEKIPLVYERAFGGADTSHQDPACHEFDPWNPVGVGFRAKSSNAPVDGTPLPNLENPSQLMITPDDRPRPIGLGFIGTHWKPRMDYQGTYDDAWMKDRMPLPPLDFDERFYNSASLGLTSGSPFVGGEIVAVTGTTESGQCMFQLPQVQFESSICIGDEVTPLPLHMNTVVIDTDQNQLMLVWRGQFNIHKRTEEVRWTHLNITAPIQLARMH